MPHDGPNPWALFCLVPLNNQAKAVVARSENEPFVSTFSSGRHALDIEHARDIEHALAIGHIRSKAGNDTLATLGRGDGADIIIGGPSISRIQCSFEINRNTNVVMLYDRSFAQTTQVLGEYAKPFEDGRPRRIVVRENLNTKVGMGGEGRDFVLFGLRWSQTTDATIDDVRNRNSICSNYKEHPKLSRTVIKEAETVLPSEQESWAQGPGSAGRETR